MPWDAAELATRPLKLAYNRVWRIYRGGYLIDVLRGEPNPQDGQFPEDWAASDTRAINEGREHLVEGLSQVLLPGESPYLRDLIAAAPEAYLGKEHVRAFGSRLALLVKLLDSAERLQIQAHPSREFSRRYLNDPFGKTESWLILATREIEGQEPYILLGFRERLTKQQMKAMVERQDVPAMEAALNKIPARPGDMYIIRAGMPHAIGPGVFMVEVQEPTDWVVSAEFQIGTVRLSERAAFMGLGIDTALDIFDYAGPLDQDAVASATLSRRRGKHPAETILIGPEDTDCFCACELQVQGELPELYRARAYSGIVIEGSGEIVLRQETIPLRPGDTFFIPASSQHDGYRSETGLRIIASFPPLP